MTKVLVGGDPATISELGESRVEGVDIGAYRFGVRGLTRRTIRDALDFRPDVVHLYEPRHVPALAALEIAGETAAPLFVRFADDDRAIESVAGGHSLHLRVAKAGLKAAAAIAPRLWPYAHPSSMSRLAATAAGLDAIAPALAREIELRTGRVCRCILPALPPPSPPTGPPPSRGEFGLPDDAQVVLFAGSVFRPQFADFELLLRAFGLLAERRSDVHLVQTGRMAERYTPELLAALMGGRSHRFHPLGFLPTEQHVARLMTVCDVLVQPGAPTEFNRLRLPAKLHDYLAAGRPVVSYAAGMEELLVDGEHAVLTRTDAPAELAAAIERILDDPVLAKRLGAAAVRRSRELFSLDRAAGELLEYYRQGVQMPLAV